MSVCSQLAPGEFDPKPNILSSPRVVADPVAIAQLDLGGDGELDVVSANHGGDSFSLWLLI